MLSLTIVEEISRTSVGLAGLTLPTYFKATASTTAPQRKAKSCIIVYTWGGMVITNRSTPSRSIRGNPREFKHIKTATPAFISANTPMLAKHSDSSPLCALASQAWRPRLGHVREYDRPQPRGAKPKSNKNWLSLASMMSYFHNPVPVPLGPSACRTRCSTTAASNLANTVVGSAPSTIPSPCARRQANRGAALTAIPTASST